MNNPTRLLIWFIFCFSAYAQEVLTFRMIHKNNDHLQQQMATGNMTSVPGYDVITQPADDATNYYWISERWEITDQRVSDLSVENTLTSGVILAFTFTPSGANRLAKVTDTTWDRQQRKLAICSGKKLIATMDIIKMNTSGVLRVATTLRQKDAQHLKQRLLESKTER